MRATGNPTAWECYGKLPSPSCSLEAAAVGSLLQSLPQFIRCSPTLSCIVVLVATFFSLWSRRESLLAYRPRCHASEVKLRAHEPWSHTARSPTLTHTHTRTSEHALSRSLLLPKKKWTCYCPAEVGTMQRSRKCYVTAAAVGAEASESTFVYV